jgi:hypothetical protein
MSSKQRKLAGADEFPFVRAKEELKRLLITQFYEDSVCRYGSDSEQACGLSRVLSPADFDAWKKRLAELARTNALRPPAASCWPIRIDRSSHDCRQIVNMNQKTRIGMDRTPGLFLVETAQDRVGSHAGPRLLRPGLPTRGRRLSTATDLPVFRNRMACYR